MTWVERLGCDLWGNLWVKKRIEWIDMDIVSL